MLPAPLASSTVKAATLVAATDTAADVVSAPVTALMEGVLEAMFTTKVKVTALLLVAVGAIGIGLGAYQTHAGATPAAQQVLVSPDKDGKLLVKTVDAKPKVVEAEKKQEPQKEQPAPARGLLIDFLPLVEAKDKNKINDRDRKVLAEILMKLAGGKVATADKARNAAEKYKFKASGILAEEAAHVVSLLPLGIDVPDFGKRGDLVWVVQFRVFRGAITQEVWVNADTEGVLAILPLKR
jgi:hypothetical protein